MNLEIFTGSGGANTPVEIPEGSVDRLADPCKPFGYLVDPGRDRGIREGEGDRREARPHSRRLTARFSSPFGPGPGLLPERSPQGRMRLSSALIGPGRQPGAFAVVMRSLIPTLAVMLAGSVAAAEAYRGQILIEEANCVACHAAEGTLPARSKMAPRLAEVGGRLHPEFIERFIRDSQGAKPGTDMPEMLAQLPDAEKATAAKALTHFLLSQKPASFTPEVPDHVAAKRGRALFHSRGCAACHAPRDEQARELPLADSVALGPLEGKYSQRSLTAFLRQPHRVRPSGRMPDLRLQERDAEDIAHFLLQHTRVPGGLRYTLYRGQVWEGIGSENVHPESGGQVADFGLERFPRIQQHSAIAFDGWFQVRAKGTHTFQITMNGGKLVVDGETLIEEPPSDRRGVKNFAAKVDLGVGAHSIQLLYYHTGREAKLAFEAQPPAKFTAERGPVEAFQAPEVDAELARQGRGYFSRLGCANCHGDVQAQRLDAPDWAALDVSRGCLADSGRGPRFAFSAEQRKMIREALPTAANPVLDEAQRVEKTLVSLRCIACHERRGLGGPSPERRALFTGTQPSLGDQGRIPPPLTGVGAKLTPEWLAEVLLRGGRQRDYLDASMPQYGEAQVGHLVELLDRVDQLEQVALPRVEQIVESKAAGYELVGTNGLGCVVCHQFNGQRAGEISALDIARSPVRLKRNWFDLYMRQPSRFHPTVIMPGFWPEGVSMRPNVLGGDSALQIEAIWNYLSDGERAKKPAGLSRETNELRVGDVAEICRGRSPAAGYRGIAVGYPERANLVFDSGEMALRMLWSGPFANVDFGSFSPRGGANAISFPPGVPFHRLQSPDENWPYKGKTNHAFPQDHGYQWRGYSLDAERRPTFRYRYGEVTVEDFFEDLNGNTLRRTLRFEAAAAQAPFHFRAAAGEKAEPISEREFRIGKLRLRLPHGATATLRAGSSHELLIPVILPPGETKLILEYSW